MTDLTDLDADLGTVEELAALADAAGYRVTLWMEEPTRRWRWRALLSCGRYGEREAYGPTAAHALAHALDRAGVAR